MKTRAATHSRTRRVHRFLALYQSSQRERLAWFSARWRLFICLLLACAILLTYGYLQGKYFAVSTAYQPVFIVSEKLFYWFIVGLFFGLAAMFLVTEGEHALGLWKLSKKLEATERGVERGIEHEIRGPAVTAPKAARGRKR